MLIDVGCNNPRTEITSVIDRRGSLKSVMRSFCHCCRSPGWDFHPTSLEQKAWKLVSPSWSSVQRKYHDRMSVVRKLRHIGTAAWTKEEYNCHHNPAVIQLGYLGPIRPHAPTEIVPDSLPYVVRNYLIVSKGYFFAFCRYVERSWFYISKFCTMWAVFLILLMCLHFFYGLWKCVSPLINFVLSRLNPGVWLLLS
jgi:hypothetical protein